MTKTEIKEVVLKMMRRGWSKTQAWHYLRGQGVHESTFDDCTTELRDEGKIVCVKRIWRLTIEPGYE